MSALRVGLPTLNEQSTSGHLGLRFEPSADQHCEKTKSSLSKPPGVTQKTSRGEPRLHVISNYRPARWREHPGVL